MSRHPAIPIPGDRLDYLVATASRAPSVHNTQPWLFRASTHAIELHRDPRRKLLVDPTGREMTISCGAALFGLRMAIRSLGYQPIVRLLPDPSRPALLAEVTLAAGWPMSDAEREMFRALAHRHTHRGAFEDGPLPPGLLTRLQYDALVECAILVYVSDSDLLQRLAALAAESDHELSRDPRIRAEVRRWTRDMDSTSRDGVPAHAIPVSGRRQTGRLAQRDFDLDRGMGTLSQTGAPAATAVLVTPGDSRADWLRAGQALHRVLLHAATHWVFASLHTQAMETAARDAIRRDLGVSGTPQMLLQLGSARVAPSTARRPPDEFTIL